MPRLELELPESQEIGNLADGAVRGLGGLGHFRAGFKENLRTTIDNPDACQDPTREQGPCTKPYTAFKSKQSSRLRRAVKPRKTAQETRQELADESGFVFDPDGISDFPQRSYHTYED